ncbi:hypothetical protein [Phytohabitans suffuscus]|uniref:Uncharacterized protein n=1 Tax=Phytohabitans suffuscus TaxID=624315 RepID=A0A6F8YIE4_9ACTN|nr:hypothetical protein [Phytohabitans suffuscus]BCB85738.1 hypothetical protein Psuf_030510 [Phytohabitans suffuscus]
MTEHTGWCERGHHCGAAEHRGAPIVVDVPAHGRATLVRVRTDDGQEHAEICLRIALSTQEQSARRQLHRLLSDLRILVIRAATAHHPRPRRRGPAA